MLTIQYEHTEAYIDRKSDICSPSPEQVDIHQHPELDSLDLTVPRASSRSGRNRLANLPVDPSAAEFAAEVGGKSTG